MHFKNIAASVSISSVCNQVTNFSCYRISVAIRQLIAVSVFMNETLRCSAQIFISYPVCVQSRFKLSKSHELFIVYKLFYRHQRVDRGSESVYKYVRIVFKSVVHSVCHFFNAFGNCC